MNARSAFAAESAAQIAARQADVARYGARAALDRWIEAKTQGALVRTLFTDEDFAVWERLFPAPATTEGP
jgi:hypothetical protein